MTANPRISLIENHDEAYHIWRAAGVADKTLVHVDAHHDMWWLADACELDIGNYVCQALKDGIVRRLFWVVPDPTWQDRASRRRLQSLVSQLVATYPRPRPRVRVEGDRITTELLGAPLTVSTLGGLPPCDDALLDLDVDFMLIPLVARATSDTHAALPWVWPAELVARLGARHLGAALTTIAYSVEGGYTPLHWKYLGDALLNEMTEVNVTRRRGFQHLRDGAAAAKRGDIEMAEAMYKLAQACLPDDAAPLYHLARLYAGSNRRVQAQTLNRDAVRLDPSYRTAYNNRGWWCMYDREFVDAEREYRSALVLDPADGYAQLGLARLAARARRWRDAEALAESALAQDPRLLDAYRVLGEALLRQGRCEASAAAYRRSLRLALDGCTPLAQPVVTAVQPGVPRDAGHGEAHARLADLDARAGRLADAVAGYRMSIAARHDLPAVRFGLARVYVRQHRWRWAAREAAAALGRLPEALRRRAVRVRSHVRRIVATRPGPFERPVWNR